ncbi:hypothetical protein [Haloarchaeobius litoreus]|uniref:SPW repeat-containing protein n=1 Tax=Haloarchaeobius litoreus TaxID=755306 RepID=A0ABD6DJH4_9EURY|nr:hypothetical protein [Haloarchaeobius litoreus]
MVLEALLGNPRAVLSSVQIAALLAATGLLLYPVVTHAENVAYTEGLVGLAVALLLLTVSNCVGLLIDAGFVSFLDSSVFVRSVVNLGASVSATVGIYYFARQFIDTSRDEVAPRETGHEGGFEDADDD